MVHIRRTRPFYRNHVLDGYLGSTGCENRVPVRVFTERHEVSENEKVRHLGSGDQTHQIEIKIGVPGRRYVIIVVELRERAIEIVLPDTPSHRGSLGRPLIRKRSRSL